MNNTTFEQAKQFVDENIIENYEEYITGPILNTAITNVIDAAKESDETKQEKLDETQLQAVNSGINYEKVNTYDSYGETKEDKSNKTQVLDDDPDKYPSSQCVSGEVDRLDERIDNISTIGRYLSTWNCTTGLPNTEPTEIPYDYRSGDYYIINQTGTVNYKPDGSQYTGDASTVVETDDVYQNDLYIFDGTTWKHMGTGGRTVSFESIVGEPDDNTNLHNRLEELDRIYFATFNVTSYNDILTAFNAGKTIYVVREHGGRTAVYQMTEKTTNEFFFTSLWSYNVTNYIGCHQTGGWSVGQTVTLENTFNKVSEIDQYSTDNQYPSAKCVYDAIMSNPNFFIAEYGETSYSDVLAAYNAGKIIIVHYTDDTLDAYGLNVAFTEQSFNFRIVDITHNYNLILNSHSGWAFGDYTFVPGSRTYQSITNPQTSFPSAMSVNSWISGVVGFVNFSNPFGTIRTAAEKIDSKITLTYYQNRVYILTRFDSTNSIAYFESQDDGVNYSVNIRRNGSDNLPGLVSDVKVSSDNLYINSVSSSDVSYELLVSLLESGKTVVLYNSQNEYYTLISYDDDGCYFTSGDRGGTWSSADNWIVSSRGLEKTTNKVINVSSSSTNTQYPSAKCLFNSLTAKQDVISDIVDIRTGAALGATAYQKPSTGIPGSDIENSSISGNKIASASITGDRIANSTIPATKLAGNIGTDKLSSSVVASLEKADVSEDTSNKETGDSLTDSTVKYPSSHTVKAITDELNERIDNIGPLGRFLSTWDSTTGLPDTEPEDIPYDYRSGDYFIVGKVGSTNYRPDGTQYTGDASTEVETDTVEVNDIYRYDSEEWVLLHISSREVSFSSITGNPSDNTALNTALAAKEDKTNKVTSISSSSTDNQYPSAKCVYTLVGNVESLLRDLL